MSLMAVSQLDRSTYYRGLLVLSGRDRVIDVRERELMLLLGKMLDFDRRFCEAAIDNLLDNKYITDEPVTFSNREIAECFLRDAIRLALVDGQVQPPEMVWLQAVATANGFSREWLDAEVRGCSTGKPVDLISGMAIRRHLA